MQIRSQKALQQLCMALGMKSTLLIWNVLPLPKWSLTTTYVTCLLMAFTLARTSTCNACDHLMASLVIQVSALGPTPQRHLLEPSIYRTDSVPLPFKSLAHYSSLLLLCVYHRSPPLQRELKKGHNFLLSHSLLYSQGSESCSIKKWVNEKTPHMHQWPKWADRQCFPSRNRRACYITICPWMDTESRLWEILGNKRWSLERWLHEVSEWKPKYWFLFWFLCFWQNTNTFYPIMLNLPKVWRKRMHISDRRSVLLLTLQKWLRFSSICINMWWLALEMEK